MGTIKIGNTVLNKGAKGEKGDSGSFRPDVRPVINIQELTTPLTGSEKELNIQADIVLSENITLPEDAIISYGGGVINANGFDVTFNQTKLTNSKWNFQSGTINDNSTFKNVFKINLEDYGLIGDGNIITNSGTDNRSCLMQIRKIGKITECDFEIHKAGNYLYSVVAYQQFEQNEPSNFYIKGKSNLYLGKDVVLGALTSALSNYDILTVDRGQESKVYGQGMIVGELRTHDFSSGVSEGCHGIILRACKNVSIEVTIKEVSGDCILGRETSELRFLNQITEDKFTKDNIINADGTVTANTDYAYSQRFNLSNHDGYFELAGGSFGGWFGLEVQQFFAVLYDNTSIDGDTTTGLIGRLGLIDTYEPIPIPENCTHVRLVIFTPLAWADLNGSLSQPSINFGIKIKSPLLTYGVRQGISNLQSYSVVDGVNFYNNGRRFDGTTGSPGYAIDQEDGYQRLHHVKILNSTFRNNKGGAIILKGSRYVEIAHNYFEEDDIAGWTNVKSISLGNSEYSSFHDNTVNDYNIELGRGDDFYANILRNVNLSFSLENSHVHDIINAENLSFSGPTVNPIEWKFLTGTSKISRFNAYRTIPLGINPVFTSIENLIIEDFEYDFRGKLYNNGQNKLSTVTSGNYDVNGSLNKFKIKNIITQAPHEIAFQTYPYDITNSLIETNVSVRSGNPKDFKHENNTIIGWLEFLLGSYTNLNEGDNTLIEVINTDIIIPNGSHTQFLNRHALTVAQKDIDFIMKGGSITMASTFQNNVINLSNNGKKQFIGVTFNSPSGSTEALDNTYDLIDCVFNNVTFTGVAFKYTTPNPNAPTYADNATALAALGEGYYYKLPTGEFGVTYTTPV